ncbi:MAG: A24 family peptidase [Gordonia sp. (in: high G+C Gram-positive bacteria)]|uniref:prepilin peptidase n=1 Tax=Gordonia sp. (in: high G+C Gram-positive bacteria) TaxID=84139 RepID=UPI0039E507DF
MTWVLAMLSVAAAVGDHRSGTIPNALTLPTMLVGVAAAWDRPQAGAAALLFGAVYLAGFLVRACGGGDVKLAPACGVLAGTPESTLLALAVAGAGTVTVCATARRRTVPHAPPLVAATLLVAALP